MNFSPQLRTPGPTPIPERVQRAMAAPMINHRGPEFKALLADVLSGLQWAFQTSNDILVFPASGTGGMESAAANLLSPNERVLVPVIGAFGERFADLAEAFGAQVVRYGVPWGEAADPNLLAPDVDADLRELVVVHEGGRSAADLRFLAPPEAVPWEEDVAPDGELDDYDEDAFEDFDEDFDEDGEDVSAFHARSLGSGGSLSASGSITIS